MNEDDNTFYKKVNNNKIWIKLNNFNKNAPIGSDNPIYAIKFERIGMNTANAYLINTINKTILASEYEIKIKDLQKTIRSRSGIIRESIVSLIDTGEIKTTYDEIKINLNKGLSMIMEEWYGTDYYLENEMPTPVDDIHVDDSMLLEAENILSSDSPILGVKKHLDNIIAGEEKNKLFVFTLALSGKMNDKKKKTIICALQEAGAGKTWLLKNITSLYNSESVSHLTQRALNYMGENLRGKDILFIKELGNLDKEGSGSGNASIKMLSVDDGGLATTYTYRKEDGSFDTKTVYTDPITILTSSTRKSIDNQFVRRYWVFSPDTSSKQTKDIMKFKIKNNYQEQEVELGMRKYTDFDFSRGVLKALVSMIPSNLKIIVPFWKTIYSIMDTNNIRMRGDYDKIKLLIYLYAVLNYRCIPMIKIDNNGKEEDYYIITPQKTIDILRIARRPLIFMSKGTEARDYDLLEALKDLNIRAQTDIYSGDEITKKVIYRISQKLGWSAARVRATLNKFVDLGFMQKRDKPTVYILDMPITKIEENLSGYSELEDIEKLKMLYKQMVKEGNKILTDKLNIDYQFGEIEYVHTDYKKV